MLVTELKRKETEPALVSLCSEFIHYLNVSLLSERDKVYAGRNFHGVFLKKCAAFGEQKAFALRKYAIAT